MNKAIEKLFNMIDLFTGILTALMTSFVFLNVVLRFVFNAGLTWSEELSRYLFVFVTYIGAISAMKSNAHLGVDTLITRVNDKLKLIIYIAIQVVIVGLMFLLVHGTFGMISMTENQTTAALRIPLPVLYSVGIVTGISILVLAIRNIIYAINHRDEIGSIIATTSEEDMLIDETIQSSTARHSKEETK